MACDIQQELAHLPHAKYFDQVDSMVRFLRAMSTRSWITQDLSAFWLLVITFSAILYARCVRRTTR